MTDFVDMSGRARAADLHTSSDAHERLKVRYRREASFKYLGMSAVLLAVFFLVLLLWTVVSSGYLAFTYNYVSLPVTLSQADIDPEKTGDPAVIGNANFDAVVRDSMSAVFPFVEGRQDRRTLIGLLTSDAGIQLRAAVLENPSLIGKTVNIPVQLDDVADLYFKNQITKRETLPTTGLLTPSATSGTITLSSSEADFIRVRNVIRDNIAEQAEVMNLRIAGKRRSQARMEGDIASMEAQVAGAGEPEKSAIQLRLDTARSALQGVVAEIETMGQKVAGIENRVENPGVNEPVTSEVPSFLVKLNGGVVKITSVTPKGVVGEALVPLASATPVPAGQWQLDLLEKPEANRKLSDREIVWLDELGSKDIVETRFNSVFFTAGASREAEQAGILGAVMGSFYTMLVTLLLSFPIGVAAAIYLEEFAPKNRITQIIEVNINNLAAVPSIVFGLLGLAMFLSIFGLPRSAPLVGGMVLALMTLPTIIIAGRAALRSVPPSIREAALGVGASKLQAVLHHVLPLAMPGILTGTIIGMAQALGETAPLLMIGMVAFIVDVPGGPLDPSTVLPVQIFMWADFPEQAFQQKTSAAILVLLAFLIAMNAIAVVLRKQFERRW